jgi:hypothetical protein
LCYGCATKLLRFLFSHKKVGEEWKMNKHIHPSADTNDAVRLALKFFNIKEKE